ncbi:MAG: NAD-dependent epimerase/dehydratase family protein [Acidobacteria bacterium]|nr:NAD-dependent epimerase/dehydratase family protein [Acidobacteriota bacterium]
MQKLRVAIIGAGYVSAHHLRALKSVASAEVVGIADLDRARAESVAGTFGIPAAFASFAEMAAATRPDVVHVLTPPEWHCAVTLEALHAGCHVFVEKPMAESEADCERMIAAAERAGRVLAVNHSARMDPVVLQAAEIAASGACGQILSVQFVRSSDYPPYMGGPMPSPYRKGSYPFQDLGVHGLAICESFLGKVRGASLDFRSTGLDANLLFDEWRATVDCDRGVGQMYISWNARPIRSEITVTGTRGVIHVDCFLQTCRVVRTLPGPKFLTNVFGALKKAGADLVQVPVNVLRFLTGRLQGAPGIHVCIHRFYDALLKGTPVETPGEEGRRVIAAMERDCACADQLKNEHRRQQLRPPAPAPVLVTGAAGFLGRRLVSRLLQQPGTVRVLVRRIPAEWKTNPRIQAVCGDLGDPEIVNRAVEGVSTVYHVGAAMKGAAADFERGTVRGTRNVIEACLAAGVKRMVYVSSLSVLDHAGRDPRVAVVENSAYEPFPARRGLYTQTKLQAEAMVISAMEERGLPAVILRPGQIFGPGAELVTPSGVIGLAGRWNVVGNGDRLLPLVYVDDVVDALQRAAVSPDCVGHIFNIVDSETVTQREYIAALQPYLQGKVKVHYVSPLVLGALALVCEAAERALKRPLPLSRYRIRSIRPLSPFDVTAARNQLQWTPRVGARQALAMAAHWNSRVADSEIAESSSHPSSFSSQPEALPNCRI